MYVERKNITVAKIKNKKFQYLCMLYIIRLNIDSTIISHKLITIWTGLRMFSASSPLSPAFWGSPTKPVRTYYIFLRFALKILEKRSLNIYMLL